MFFEVVRDGFEWFWMVLRACWWGMDLTFFKGKHPKTGPCWVSVCRGGKRAGNTPKPNIDFQEWRHESVAEPK